MVTACITFCEDIQRPPQQFRALSPTLGMGAAREAQACGASGRTPGFSVSPDTVLQLYPCPGLFQRHPPVQLWHLRLQPCLYLHCEFRGTQCADPRHPFSHLLPEQAL